MLYWKVLSYTLFAVSVLGLCAPVSCFPDTLSNPKKLRFERISVDNGLSESGVLCLIQDSQGFLWIGTYDGLNRYDGYEFLVYRPDPHDPHSMSDTGIRALHEDRSGRIWVGTSDGGVNVFDKMTGRFQRYQATPGNPEGLSDNQVRAILEDHRGIVWVGTQNGLNAFDPRTRKFRHYKHDPDDPKSISAGCINVIYEDPDRNLWIGAETGLSRFHRETNSFSNIPHNPTHPLEPDSTGGYDIRYLYFEAPDFLWIGSKRPGLNRLEISTGKINHYLSLCEVYCIHQDRRGNFWVGTDKGLARRFTFISKREKSPSYYFYFDKHSPYDSESLSHNTVFSILEDEGGILWFGTLGGGLSKLYPALQTFTLMRREPENESSLSGNHISAICESKDDILWVGTYKNGLNRVDRKTGQVTRLSLADIIPDSPQGNIVRFLTIDREGYLWMGTGKTGLVRMDQQLEDIQIYRNDINDPESLSEDNVYFIMEDTWGKIWVGTSTKGLNCLNRETGKFKRYRNTPGDFGSISHNRIRHIFEGRDGSLWIGTNRGLNRFDRKKETFVHWEHDPDRPDSLSHNRVTPILEDENGILWVGTDMGLNRFDRATRIFKRYTTKDGLENDAIQAMEFDDRGRLWMSTFKGISMLDPKTDEIRNYNYRDGLQGTEFWFNAGFKNRKGEIFFGGLNGLNFFFPEDIKINRHKPPVVITQLKVMNQTRAMSLGAHNTIDIFLSYKDLFFSISFAGLDYAAPEENVYRYMLEGFDRDWVDIGHSRTAVYTNIDPGRYEFRVKAANNDGVWNERESCVKLIITPPYWRTGWFKALAALTVVTLLLGIYTYRVRLLKIQRENLEELVSERTSELKDEIKERKQIEAALQEARDYLEERVIERTERLRRLTSELSLTEERERRAIATNIHDNISQNLVLSEMKLKQIVKDGLPPEHKPLIRETTELINKISQDVRSLMTELSPPILYDIGLEAALGWLAEQFGEKYGIRTVFINHSERLNIDDDLKTLLFRSVRELMFNVVKHAHANTVTIIISSGDSNITIDVHDNGIGFDVTNFDERSDNLHSFGLFSVRERLLAIGGQLIMESGRQEGVKVTITVPIRKG